MFKKQHSYLCSQSVMAAFVLKCQCETFNCFQMNYRVFISWLCVSLKYFGCAGFYKIRYVEIGRHRGIIANEHIKIGSNSYEKVEKYLRPLVTNQNSIQEEIKCRLKAGNSCYYSVQTLLSSRPDSRNLKISINMVDSTNSDPDFMNAIITVTSPGCTGFITMRIRREH